MFIDLANVGTTARVIELTFDSAEIDLESEILMLTGQTSFSGEIERAATRVHLRGVIKTNVLLDCTRCLEAIARYLDFPFRAIFVDSSDEDTNADAEIGDDALDESLVQEGKIDMAEVVREQILLALPEQIFCREDCKGLCPKCGSNLNLIDCKCADEEVDPRWAALKNLK